MNQIDKYLVADNLNLSPVLSVDRTGFEPVTSALSKQRSEPTELAIRSGWYWVLGAGYWVLGTHCKYCINIEHLQGITVSLSFATLRMTTPL